MWHSYPDWKKKPLDSTRPSPAHPKTRRATKRKLKHVRKACELRMRKCATWNLAPSTPKSCRNLIVAAVHQDISLHAAPHAQRGRRVLILRECLEHVKNLLRSSSTHRETTRASSSEANQALMLCATERFLAMDQVAVSATLSVSQHAHKDL
jgi:hypothetical protein